MCEGEVGWEGVRWDVGMPSDHLLTLVTAKFLDHYGLDVDESFTKFRGSQL